MIDPLQRSSRVFGTGLALCCALVLAACTAATSESQEAPCDPDNGGLTLPEGFCAAVVADSVGPARHIAVDNEGDIYVALSDERDGHGSVAVRDVDGDFRADTMAYFGEVTGTGMELHDGYLYRSSDMAVYRYPLAEGELVPGGERETIIAELPDQESHAAKSLALDGSGNLYVNIGAPSNACQEEDRTPGTPGQDPCPLLEQHGGIWQFSATETEQDQAAGTRYATGIRNAVALAWNDAVGSLYLVQHGRDQLSQLWSDLFTNEQSAELPAEEFFRVDEGANFGWPYCYYDPEQEQKVLSPEYGGDGTEVGRCAAFEDPIAAFPAHWAPNDLLFYQGEQFPERYRNGAFIAFHGSWNRAPMPQQGYRVAFVPMADGMPSGDWETFANGFAGAETIESPGQAEYRPTGLAVGPDGALYIVDSEKGRIWRVTYTG